MLVAVAPVAAETVVVLAMVVAPATEESAAAVAAAALVRRAIEANGPLEAKPRPRSHKVQGEQEAKKLSSSTLVPRFPPI